MTSQKLFRQTQLRLAVCYTLVMGGILTLLGLGVYRAIAHAHVHALDRELLSVAGTLHDSLELKLNNPGQLEPVVRQLLPDLTINGNCTKQIPNNFSLYSPTSPHNLSAIAHSNYYVRLLDLSGCLIAQLGITPNMIMSVGATKSQIFTDNQGKKFQEISLLLHTANHQNWGYLQVGRNFTEYEQYMNRVKWILGLGLPISLFIVGGASWGLAGLAMQPIYQSYRQIQQFTADAAHELRTPLATIQATLESALLSPELLNTETEPIFKQLERQNRRLYSLVADLLFLARLDYQPQTELKEACCLHDIISDLVEEFASLALAKEINLHYQFLVTELINIWGNQDQLYRLVSNLIVNAIQYTPAGGEVLVTLNYLDHYAIISVKDTGMGISSEQQSRIFQRFYRVMDDRSRHTGGAGLGLAIAQAIVKTHRGDIQVTSDLGQGSVFTIRLPG